MITAAILAVLAAILALAVVLQFRGDRNAARLYPPPGRMVDVGGRRLHTRVLGSGAPPVIFESGISASSINWAALQLRIAETTTAVAYDRAGLGWSDPARGPFNSEQMLADFTALLDRLQLPAPYVLVGHSYGGLLVRLYAERNPQKVAGLVLVDPVPACEWAKPNLNQKRLLRAGWVLSSWGEFLARFGVVRFATAPLLRGSTRIPKLVAKASAGPAARTLDRLVGEVRKLPPDTWPVIRAHWCRPSNFRALSKHLKALTSSFNRLRNMKLDFPVVVVSAANLPPEALAEHRAIAALSARGEHLVLSRGGHWVQLEDPELVADAIRRLVDSRRVLFPT